MHQGQQRRIKKSLPQSVLRISDHPVGGTKIQLSKYVENIVMHPPFSSFLPQAWPNVASTDGCANIARTIS